MRMRRPAPAIAAILGIAILALPPVRRGLEASMTLHMLVQFPLLVAAGAILAGALPLRWRSRVQAWNSHGITGLVAGALVLMLFMIPLLLDRAVVDGQVDAVKFVALLACGAAFRLSWQRAGLLVQAFYLGNMLPMTAAIGQVYMDSPLRLCNAYLLEDQARLGLGLIVLAVLAAAASIVHVVRTGALASGPRGIHPLT
jgi:hypothetical protein